MHIAALAPDGEGDARSRHQVSFVSGIHEHASAKFFARFHDDGRDAFAFPDNALACLSGHGEEKPVSAIRRRALAFTIEPFAVNDGDLGFSFIQRS